jgi:predicted ATPase/DNA-binding XRE family transcriptional regulator
MSETISFGTWLRQRRRALDLTQKALAEQVGCAEITLRRMEADSYKPSTELALVLLEKLGIPESERPQWVRFARGFSSLPENSPSPQSEHPNNLPHQLTSFIGREKEIAEVVHLVTTHHLVTLTGAGGTGKTRLSLQVASELLTAFPDGIWQVDFTPINETLLVPYTVANLFGLREPGDAKPSITELLVDHFRSRQALLIFDNCEHLIEAIAKLADLLVQSSMKLHILATSREALGIKGEMIYRVPSLKNPVPELGLASLMESESVRLFVERASDSVVGFSLTPNNASAVAQICIRLDGIPLALELAAARIKIMTVEEIASRLDNRFQLLTNGARTALPRHQTLRAMIDWSYDLLSEQERILFRRLAVFVGGWTLEAAESVCSGDGIESDQVLDLMSQLVNKSLIFVNIVGGISRYRRLETIREYAREKLDASGESVAVHDNHLEFFLKLAETAEPHLYSRDAIEWCNRIEADHDNLRLALDWAQGSKDRAENGLRIVSALIDFWLTRGYLVEGRERTSAMLAHANDFQRTALYSNVLSNAAWFASFLGDFPGARAFANEALEISRELNDKLGISYALHVQGAVAIDNNEYALAEKLLEEALQNKRELNNVPLLGLLTTMGWSAFGVGDYPLARRRLNEVLLLATQAGNKDNVSTALGGLAEVDLREGRYDSATKLIEECIAIEREFDDKWHLGVALGVWSWIAVLQGDWDVALSRLKESIAIRKEISDKGGLVWCVEKSGQVMLGMKEEIKAVKLFSAAESIRAALGSTMDPFDQTQYQKDIAALRNGLGEETFNVTWNQGSLLTLEDAIAFALEEKPK